MTIHLQTLKLVWVKQGTIRWENWWIEQNGHKLETIPGLLDHISFANFDLQHNGCPLIIIDDSCLEIRNIPDDKIDLIKGIIYYHGFSLRDSSPFM